MATNIPEMKFVGQDIKLFLRLASLHVEQHPDKIPCSPKTARLAISWLWGLAEQYGNGEEIASLSKTTHSIT